MVVPMIMKPNSFFFHSQYNVRIKYGKSHHEIKESCDNSTFLNLELREEAGHMIHISKLFKYRCTPNNQLMHLEVPTACGHVVCASIVLGYVVTVVARQNKWLILPFFLSFSLC